MITSWDFSLKKKNSKKKNKSHRYGNDIIAYYGKEQNRNMYGFYYVPEDPVTQQEIHNIATEIFGKTFYIDYDTFVKEKVFEPEILFTKEK
jgi:hypothetical protein